MLVFSLIPFIVSFNLSSFLSTIEVNCDYKTQSLCFCLFQGNIELNYDVNDIPDTIRPETDTVRVDLYINHYVSGLLSKILIPFYSGYTVPIELSVSETPGWLEASIAPGMVYLRLSTQKKSVPEPAILILTVSRVAPAFKAETVEIVATHGYLAPLTAPAKMKLWIAIRPGYYSHCNFNLKTFDQIGPGEIAIFPINITNYGNYPTKITFEILDHAKDWNTSIVPEIIVGSKSYGQDYNATVNFIVRSPDVSGYVDETRRFNIRCTTMAAGHPEAGIDNTTILQFTVRCRNY